jgi:hypothetical protein
MAASVVLAVLSRMTWIYVNSIDGILSSFAMRRFGVRGQDLDNVTESDGNAVLIIAGACAAIAFVSLSGPPIRRLCGAAIAIAAGLAATIALVNAFDALRGTAEYNEWDSAQTGDFSVAFPLLLTIVVGLAVAGLGALIAAAPDEIERIDISEDGALQW